LAELDDSGLQLGPRAVSIRSVPNDESASALQGREGETARDMLPAQESHSEGPTAVTAVPEPEADDQPTHPPHSPTVTDEPETAPPFAPGEVAASSFVWELEPDEDPTTGVSLRPPPVSLPTETVPRTAQRPATRPPSFAGPPTVDADLPAALLRKSGDDANETIDEDTPHRPSAPTVNVQAVAAPTIPPSSIPPSPIPSPSIPPPSIPVPPSSMQSPSIPVPPPSIPVPPSSIPSPALPVPPSIPAPPASTPQARAGPATRPDTALPVPQATGGGDRPPPGDFAGPGSDADSGTPSGYRIGPDGREDPRFGDYLLLGRVGAGGMAEIQLAVQVGAHGFQKPCVVKRIALERLQDQDHRQLFREEGKICMRLRHPNVVHFYEFGEVHNIPYIAMELVDGVDLARLDAMTGSEGLPLRVIIEIGYRVADALAYAHALDGEDGQALNLVHRDISPQNILVSREGEVKLADFGIARFDGRMFETGLGPPKGKLRYIAPEQLVFGDRPDHRVDIFSLGMVLAEIITRNPFMPEGPLVLGPVEPSLRAAFERHPRFVPPVLIELLVEMTGYAAGDRPPSAQDVADRLRAVERTLQAQDRLNEYVPSRISARIPTAEKVMFRLLEGADGSEVMADPTAPLVPSFPSGRLAEPVPGATAYPTVGLVLDLEEQAEAQISRSNPESPAPSPGTAPLPESAIVGPAPQTVPTAIPPRPPKKREELPGWWWAMLGALLAMVAVAAWVILGRH